MNYRKNIQRPARLLSFLTGRVAYLNGTSAARGILDEALNSGRGGYQP